MKQNGAQTGADVLGSDKPGAVRDTFEAYFRKREKDANDKVLYEYIQEVLRPYHYIDIQGFKSNGSGEIIIYGKQVDPRRNRISDAFRIDDRLYEPRVLWH